MNLQYFCETLIRCGQYLHTKYKTVGISLENVLECINLYQVNVLI